MTTTKTKAPSLVLNSKVLAAALKRLSPFVQTNPIIPAYENVRLLADGDTLRLTAGGEVTSCTITLALPERMENPLSLCLEHAPLTKLLGTLPDQPVRLRGGEAEEVILSWKGGKCVLPGIDAADYPNPKRATNETVWSLKGAEAAELSLYLEMALHYADLTDTWNDWSRSVWCYPLEHGADIFAYRGAMCLSSVVLPPPATTYDFPARCVKLIAPLLVSGQPITLSRSAEWLLVEADDARIHLRLYDTAARGILKDNAAILRAKNFPTTLTFQQSQLVGVLDRMLAVPSIGGLAKEKAPAPEATLSWSGQVDGTTLRLSLSSFGDLYRLDEGVECQGDESEFTKTFQVRELLQPLTDLGPGLIRMQTSPDSNSMVMLSNYARPNVSIAFMPRIPVNQR